MFNLLKNWFNYNEKELKRIAKIVEQVNALEAEISELSDEELKAKTPEFKERLAKGETLDDLLPESFAVVREASKRVLGMRHFDVQLIGGIVLHEGNIAEMKTGEGKTLVATLPAYLNALTGKGIHIITVNDYLAKRDSEWMGQIYKFMGLSVGLIVHGLSYDERQVAYGCDIIYGTNNEFGFDYLRDNMSLAKDFLVQRELNYAIVDEVDSILIDEARTPLIISGQSDKPTDLYYQFAQIVKNMKEGEDYTVDEKAHSAMPTEQGIAKVEKIMGVDNLYDDEHMDLSHYLNQALKAKTLMHRDQNYVVHEGQIVIVDEFTGRLMFGRRYSDGLHQAIEAKEGVKIEQESQTLATITFQNYFRMYSKLSGMTGTALTEEEEFNKIYGLDVIVIPTNKDMVRVDYPDVIYQTEEAKFRNVIKEIKSCHETGQPVLVGTITIENSEKLSRLLDKAGIKHEVLNAKHHEREAEIVAQAGRYGAVTIATNMAGRGTDIILGGNPEFLAKHQLRKFGYEDDLIALASSEYVPEGAGEELIEVRNKFIELEKRYRGETAEEREKVVQVGGLHIIGTERHESRRIDNQLRGRSGRQGDPGSSRFYISLEDDLMRLFGSDNIASLMEKLGVDEDEPIEHNLVTKALENAQKRVESRNFSIRKRVLEYDDVMNKQREVIYEQRRDLLFSTDLRGYIFDMLDDSISEAVGLYLNEDMEPEDWDVQGLLDFVNSNILPVGYIQAEDFKGLSPKEIEEKLINDARAFYDERENLVGSERMREIEKVISLKVVDGKWMDHLDAMDDLREGIGLRAYGQRNPLIEYQREAYDMFNGMIQSIKEDIVKYMFKIHIEPRGEGPIGSKRPGFKNMKYERAALSGTMSSAPLMDGPQAEEPAKQEPVRVEKVGRNEPCPCGSGKKYKHCHGRD